MLSLGIGIAVAAIVIACIGFLAVLVLFGVRRYWAAAAAGSGTKKGGNFEGDEKEEMEWDNSALTITVNPMDDFYDEQNLRLAKEDDDDDDDDNDNDALDKNDDNQSNPDVNGCRTELSSDGEEEDENIEHHQMRCKELEWDDSTLTF